MAGALAASGFTSKKWVIFVVRGLTRTGLGVSCWHMNEPVTERKTGREIDSRLWREVLALANGRCQCGGQCRRHGGRCRERFGQGLFFGGTVEPVAVLTVRFKKDLVPANVRAVCRDCARDFQLPEQRNRSERALTEPSKEMIEKFKERGIL